MSNNQKRQYTFRFGEVELFTNKFKKEHKKLISADLDGEKYLLYTAKKKEKRNLPFGDKLLLLFLYEMKVSRNVYAVYESKRKNATVYVSLHAKEDKTIEANVTVCPLFEGNTEENFEERAENHFLGNPYMVLDSTEKELSAKYEKSNVAAVILIFLLMAATLYGMIQYSMTDDQQSSLVSAPPPMPQISALTEDESFELKRMLSVKVIAKFIKEVNDFKEKKDPKISRMPSLSVTEFEDIPFSAPELNAESNRWEYPSGEQYKRGGVRSSLAIVYQKKIPSKGFTLSSDGNVLIYQKNINEDIETLGTALIGQPKKGNPAFTESCLKNLLSLSENVVPYSQEEGYISFMVKEDNPYLVYNKMPKLFEECPLTLTSLSIIDGKYQARIKAKKGNKETLASEEETYAQN